MNKVIAFATATALIAGAIPAFAATNDIVVENTNSAMVSNTVTSSATTGGNVANGARAHNSTTGGNLSDSDYNNKAGNGV